jgi:hypothetical protein
MRSRTLATLGLLAALAISADGCVVQVGFDPTGTDVELQGSWTINGADPATSCGAVNADTVRLFICDAANAGCYADPDKHFVFPCTQGSFDTSTTMFPENEDPDSLAHGVYYLHWEAYDAEGKRLLKAPPHELDIEDDAVTSVVLWPEPDDPEDPPAGPEDLIVPIPMTIHFDTGGRATPNERHWFPKASPTRKVG